MFLSDDKQDIEVNGHRYHSYAPIEEVTFDPQHKFMYLKIGGEIKVAISVDLHNDVISLTGEHNLVALFDTTDKKTTEVNLNLIPLVNFETISTKIFDYEELIRPFTKDKNYYTFEDLIISKNDDTSISITVDHTLLDNDDKLSNTRSNAPYILHKGEYFIDVAYKFAFVISDINFFKLFEIFNDYISYRNTLVEHIIYPVKTYTVTLYDEDKKIVKSYKFANAAICGYELYVIFKITNNETLFLNGKFIAYSKKIYTLNVGDNIVTTKTLSYTKVLVNEKKNLLDKYVAFKLDFKNEMQKYEILEYFDANTFVLDENDQLHVGENNAQLSDGLWIIDSNEILCTIKPTDRHPVIIDEVHFQEKYEIVG